MLRIRKHTFLSIVISFGLMIGSACAQDAKKDLTELNSYFMKYPNLSLETVYTIFESHTGAKAIESTNGVYKKMGDKMYSNTMGIETLYGDKYVIVVDNNDKAILVSDRSNKEIQQPNLMAFDSLMNWCGNVKFNVVANGQKKYALNFFKQEWFDYDAIDIYMTKENCMEKLVLFNRDSLDISETEDVQTMILPRVEILYKNFKFSPSFSKEDFSENTFVVLSGNTLICASRYKGYQIIDHRLSAYKK